MIDWVDWQLQKNIGAYTRTVLVYLVILGKCQKSAYSIGTPVYIQYYIFINSQMVGS